MIRVFRFHMPLPVLCLAAADALIFFVSITIGLVIRWATLERVFSLDGPLIWQVLLYTGLNSSILIVLGAFRRQTLINLKALSVIIILGFVLSIVTHTTIFYAIPSTRIWLSTFVPALLISLIGVFGIHFLFDRFIAFRRFRRRILVLGAGKTAARIADLMRSGRVPMVHCVGYIPIEPVALKVPKQDLLESPKPLTDQILELNVDEVVVALEERRNHLPVDALLGLRLKGLLISNISTFLEREEGHVELETLHPSWMIFSTGFNAATRIQGLIKRVFDILGSLLILTALFPCYAFAALALRIEGSGPVFYRQERVGLNGRRFDLVKFRSMQTDSESDGVPKWAEINDPRITRVGRVLRRMRIDELPQIWNVLCGQMSLIGPRPERPEFIAQLEEEIPYYNYRHTVKPGISGWAQINYPYGASIEDSKEKLKYDLYYIKNYSLFLDLIVLMLTIRVVFWPERRREMLDREDAAQAPESTELDQPTTTS